MELKLCRELGDGPRSTVVCPETPETIQKRQKQPEMFVETQKNAPAGRVYRGAHP